MPSWEQALLAETCLTIIIISDIQEKTLLEGCLIQILYISKVTSNELAEQFAYNHSISSEKFCHSIKCNHVELVSKVVALLKVISTPLSEECQAIKSCLHTTSKDNLKYMTDMDFSTERCDELKC